MILGHCSIGMTLGSISHLASRIPIFCVSFTQINDSLIVRVGYVIFLAFDWDLIKGML